MRAVDLIRKKRDSGEHSREELEFLISGYTNGDTQSAVPGEDEFYAVRQYQSEGLIGSEASRSQTPHRPISHVCQGGLLFLISTHACRKLTEVRTRPKMEGNPTNQAHRRSIIFCQAHSRAAAAYLRETDPSSSLMRVIFPQRVLCINCLLSDENSKIPPSNHSGVSSVRAVPVFAATFSGDQSSLRSISFTNTP